jgi:lipid-A-disaccharide synthase
LKNKDWIGLSIGEVSGVNRFSSVESVLIKTLKKQGYYNGEFDFKGTFDPTKINSIQGELTSHNWAEIEEMSAYGLRAVLKKLPFYMSLMKRWKKEVLSSKPKALILVDFADFNIRLASFAQKNGVKVIWLAPPQIWAWRESRKKKLQGIDLACLFDFEAQKYRDWGLNAEWLGFDYQQKFLKNKESKVGLFMGSRQGNWSKQSPLFFDVLKAFQGEMKRLNNTFVEGVVVLPNSKLVDRFNSQFPLCEVEVKSQKESKELSYAFAVPGTITLELAIDKIPFQVIYKGSKFKKWMLNSRLKIKTFSLANILLRRMQYTEQYFTKFDSNNNPLLGEWEKEFKGKNQTEFNFLDEVKLMPLNVEDHWSRLLDRKTKING